MMKPSEFPDFVRASAWQSAKTMPHNPHEYTLIRRTDRTDRFRAAVLFIREYATLEWYGARWYQCYYSGGYKYWTMGAPLNDTILINRCRIYNEEGYDNVADKYDATYSNPTCEAQNRALAEMLRARIGKAPVLDVGCGTGLYIELMRPTPLEYVGLDVSRRMLHQHAMKYAGHKRVWSKLGKYKASKRYPAVVGLFSGDYLEAEDVLSHLEPGGELFIIYNAPHRTSEVQHTNPEYIIPDHRTKEWLRNTYAPAGVEVFDWEDYYIVATPIRE